MCASASKRFGSRKSTSEMLSSGMNSISLVKSVSYANDRFLSKFQSVWLDIFGCEILFCGSGLPASVLCEKVFLSKKEFIGRALGLELSELYSNESSGCSLV